MKTVTLEQARRQFDALIAEVAGGGRVEIVADGRPLARLLPVPPPSDDEPVPADEVERAFYGD
jgi:prevent-host-death family protein